MVNVDDPGFRRRPLASTASDHITRQTIYVDGGFSAT
jgi:hypothetical protein